MSIFIVDLNSIMHLVVYKMLHCKGAVNFFRWKHTFTNRNNGNKVVVFIAISKNKIIKKQKKTKIKLQGSQWDFSSSCWFVCCCKHASNLPVTVGTRISLNIIILHWFWDKNIIKHNYIALISISHSSFVINENEQWNVFKEVILNIYI